MTFTELKATFDKHEDDFLEFSQVKNKRHQRKDLCAFLFLAEKFPQEQDIVQCAEHDEIWLSPELDQEGDIPLTEEDVIFLCRCGIRLTDNDTFGMFV